MTTKPDYTRIAELERAIYGKTITERDLFEPAIIVPWDLPAASVLSYEIDAAFRDVVRFLTWRGPLPGAEGSRVAAAGRLVVLGLLGFAGLWLCLMLVGVVPWSS